MVSILEIIKQLTIERTDKMNTLQDKPWDKVFKRMTFICLVLLSIGTIYATIMSEPILGAIYAVGVMICAILNMLFVKIDLDNAMSEQRELDNESMLQQIMTQLNVLNKRKN